MQLDLLLSYVLVTNSTRLQFDAVRLSFDNGRRIEVESQLVSSPLYALFTLVDFLAENVADVLLCRLTCCRHKKVDRSFRRVISRQSDFVADTIREYERLQLRFHFDSTSYDSRTTAKYSVESNSNRSCNHYCLIRERTRARANSTDRPGRVHLSEGSFVRNV